MRYRLLLLIVAIALLSATLASADGPIYKFPNINPLPFSQYAPFQMLQGWANNQLAWYVATDSSDQQIACELLAKQAKVAIWELNYAPRLADLAGQVATAYVVTNLNQGPVFTAVPGDPAYSGIWQLVFVTYNSGAVKHFVKNANPYDPVTNPFGLPSPSDATYTTLNKAGLPVVVKFPIVALGALGGPWSPAVPGSYRIPQGKVEPNYAYSKIIWLPFWQVYCQDQVTKEVFVDRVAIPDAYDPPGLPVADQLLPKLKANSAPGLALINRWDTQSFYWQIGIQPLSQLPVLQACPTPYVEPCFNMNQDYIPVETVVVVQRNIPPLPASTIINNEQLIFRYEGSGLLTQVRASQIINATVLERYDQ